MEESLNPTVNIGPISFDLTLLAMSLVTVLMVFAFVYWASRKMTIRPKGKQNALEMIYDFVVSFVKPNIGESYIISRAFCLPFGRMVILRLAQ